MSFIEIKNLVKEYQTGTEKVYAVNDVSLNIEENDFVMLFGQSGSGKSTLLTILGGLNKPTSGEIIVDEINLYKLNSKQRSDFRREYIGFIFQNFQLIPYLTVEENVMLPLAIAEYTKTEQKEIVFSLLTKVKLADKSKRLINELSGGEQQRVAIARALVNDPLIFLADEPTGDLDSKTSNSIMNIFTELNNEGKTIVVVTHNKEFIKYANRRIELSDGKIIKADYMPIEMEIVHSIHLNE